MLYGQPQSFLSGGTLENFIAVEFKELGDVCADLIVIFDQEDQRPFGIVIGVLVYFPEAVFRERVVQKNSFVIICQPVVRMGQLAIVKVSVTASKYHSKPRKTGDMGLRLPALDKDLSFVKVDDALGKSKTDTEPRLPDS